MKPGQRRPTVLIDAAYRIAVAVLVPLASLALRSPATRRAHKGRLAAADRLAAWGEAERDPQRPLAWFHAASVGEGLQARAVLTELRRLRPEFQTIFTHFSASADWLEGSMPVDFAGYLPYDRRSDVTRALDALRVDILVFAKLDVWPELATQAKARGSRVALVAGSVDPGSARLGRVARAVGRRGYAALDLAGVISEADGERLSWLGADPARTVVTGDPRIDAVLDAIETRWSDWSGTPDPQLLVAGSTWPVDEQMLLPALASVRADHPGARILVVPHEPGTERIAELLALAARLNLPARIWQEGAELDTAVTVVDQLGQLAGLYRLGAMAYVGGGFGSRGIHSVLEPAGWRRAIVIGPNDRGVRDAEILAKAGGLIRLPNTAGIEPLVRLWSDWLTRPAVVTQAGEAAGNAVATDRGAARRSATLLAELV